MFSFPFTMGDAPTLKSRELEGGFKEPLIEIGSIFKRVSGIFSLFGPPFMQRLADLFPVLI